MTTCYGSSVIIGVFEDKANTITSLQTPLIPGSVQPEDVPTLLFLRDKKSEPATELMPSANPEEEVIVPCLEPDAFFR